MDMDNENRIVTPDLSPEDSDIEFSLRPRRLTDYIGQEKAKENPLGLYRGCPPQRRLPRPRFALRPSRTRQNNSCGHNSE